MSFLQRKKTTVGLDIGSGLIKVVVIDHGKREPRITKVVIMPLMADAIVEGEIMDPGLVSEAIAAALVEAGVTTKEVVVAVGGRDVIIKKIQIERVKEHQARELMRWEAEQHVPFDMESVELDFQILDPDATGPQMQVLLVAAKRELVESKMRVLGEAGLEPSLVDVEAFALHNAFALNHPDALTGMVALLNIGHEVTNINILDDGVPILTRDITVGTRKFREDLQKDWALSLDEAAALLQGYDKTKALDAVVAVRGEEIITGIDRAISFLETNARNGGALRTMFLCGGGSRIPGLDDLLGQRLGIAIEHANALGNLHVMDGALDGLVADEIAPLLMLPIGLALRQNQ